MSEREREEGGVVTSLSFAHIPVSAPLEGRKGHIPRRCQFESAGRHRPAARRIDPAFHLSPSTLDVISSLGCALSPAAVTLVAAAVATAVTATRPCPPGPSRPSIPAARSHRPFIPPHPSDVTYDG